MYCRKSAHNYGGPEYLETSGDANLAEKVVLNMVHGMEDK